MRYELICDLAGIPGGNRPPGLPELPSKLFPLPPPPQQWTPKRKVPKKPPRVVARPEPEPNLLAMGEVDLICWETMPPLTP